MRKLYLFVGALLVVALLVLVLVACQTDQPGEATGLDEFLEAGGAHLEAGEYAEAVADLESYLAASPAAPDADSVRGRVVWLRRRLSEMN